MSKPLGSDGVAAYGTSREAPNVIGTALKWYLAGLLSGIIGTIIIFIKLKK